MTGQGRGRVKRDARGREIYAEIKALPPLIVRADGRHFKSLLRDRERFRKPYDERFAQGMAEATVRFFAQSGFDPRLAYLFSDEINLLFTQVPFNARVEKLDSLIASFLASALTLSLDLHDSPVAFDARVIPLCGGEDAREYLAQRQAEAWRNHLNAYGYYGLQAAGMSEREAEERLKGLKAAAVHELLFQQGINLTDTPAWQRRGMVVAKERYEKLGYDRQRAVEVNVIRYKVVQCWDIPRFNTEEGRLFLSRFIHHE